MKLLATLLLLSLTLFGTDKNDLTLNDKEEIRALFKAYQTNVLTLKKDKAKALFVSKNVPVTGVYRMGGDVYSADSRMDMYTNMSIMGDPIDVHVFNSKFISSKGMALTFGEYETKVKGEVKYSGKNMWAFVKENGKWKISSIAYLPKMRPQMPPFKSSENEILTFIKDYEFALNTQRASLVSMFSRDASFDMYSGEGYYLSKNDEGLKSSNKILSSVKRKDRIKRKFSNISIQIHNELTASVEMDYELSINGKVVRSGKEIIGLVTLDNSWKINAVLWN